MSLSTAVSSYTLGGGTTSLFQGHNILNGIVAGPGATVTVYDNGSGAASGNVIASLINAGTTTSQVLPVYGVRCFNGLVVNVSGGLAAPVQSAATTSTTGGTGLAATTAYFYVVTALTASGESLKSNEQTVTTGAGATNSNTVSWAAVTGATGYRVYRGTTTGVENVYYQVGTVTSYVDTGAASTAGTPPTTNTTAVGWVFYAAT